MRYFQKLLCLLILVLAASFGVGGCVLLYSDFSVQRSRMAAANAAAQSVHGNKTAGQRARKASLELSKLLKEFRRVSVEAGR